MKPYGSNGVTWAYRGLMFHSRKPKTENRAVFHFILHWWQSWPTCLIETVTFF